LAFFPFGWAERKRQLKLSHRPTDPLCGNGGDGPARASAILVGGSPHHHLGLQPRITCASAVRETRTDSGRAAPPRVPQAKTGESRDHLPTLMPGPRPRPTHSEPRTAANCVPQSSSPASDIQGPTHPAAGYPFHCSCARSGKALLAPDVARGPARPHPEKDGGG
jgi:hypothetical protein